MSKKQLEIYKAEDFREADRLGRIQMWLMQFELFDGMLSDADQRYYNDLHQAYQACFMELRSTVAIKWIQSNIRGAESWYKANQIFADMQALFGRFVEKNKAFQKSIIVEKLYNHAAVLEKNANILEKEGKIVEGAMLRDMAGNKLEKAAKLEGLYDLEEGFDPSEFEFPEIEVTSDPAALEEPYTEFEDVTNNLDNAEEAA